MEVRIINAAGEVVLDTLVLYKRSWKQIYDEGSDAVRLMMNMQEKMVQMGRRLELPTFSHSR